MADTNTPFNPADLVKFMTNSAKEAALNAHIKAEFRKLQNAVDDFSKLFEPGYEAPAPKVRAKRGTGAIAQKKKATKSGEPGHGGSNVSKK